MWDFDSLEGCDGDSLTDEEWYTIKSYKTVLDVFFNEKAGIEKAIKANEEIIANL